MADRRAFSQQEKSKEATGNVVSRFIRRLSPTKRCRDESNPTPSSSSHSYKETFPSRKFAKQESAPLENTSSFKSYKSQTITKMSLNEPSTSNSSSVSNLSTPSQWLTPAPSYQSVNQTEKATELKLLSQLHSTFDEATGILGAYVSLRDRKK